MEIRIARVADAIAIADLHTESWRNTYKNVLTKDYLRDIVPQERKNIWQKWLNSPKDNQYVLIAESNGVLVGFACAFVNEHDDWGSYLENLHINKAYQSKGIGKLLLLKIADFCNKRTSTKGMCLLVNQDNVNAQNFYLYLGAKNIQTSTWNAPDGSIVPTYWFVWDDLDELKEANKYEETNNLP